MAEKKRFIEAPVTGTNTKKIYGRLETVSPSEEPVLRELCRPAPPHITWYSKLLNCCRYTLKTCIKSKTLS